VDISSKEVVENLFLVACICIGMDCFYTRGFVLMVITQLQEQAESERKKEEGH
jgi:hypothetical protein